MLIIWNYGAVGQYQQGVGPVWNWSAEAGAASADGPVCGTLAVGTVVNGTLAVSTVVNGTLAVEEC